MKEFFAKLSTTTGSLNGSRLVYLGGPDTPKPPEAAPVMDFRENPLTKEQIKDLQTSVDKTMADNQSASRKITMPPMYVKGEVPKAENSVLENNPHFKDVLSLNIDISENLPDKLATQLNKKLGQIDIAHMDDNQFKVLRQAVDAIVDLPSQGAGDKEVALAVNKFAMRYPNLKAVAALGDRGILPALKKMDKQSTGSQVVSNQPNPPSREK